MRANAQQEHILKGIENKKPARAIKLRRVYKWHPQGDSNPCCRRERAVS